MTSHIPEKEGKDGVVSGGIYSRDWPSRKLQEMAFLYPVLLLTVHKRVHCVPVEWAVRSVGVIRAGPVRSSSRVLYGIRNSGSLKTQSP